MIYLKLDDIEEWLAGNKEECQDLEVQGLPPLYSKLYDVYSRVYNFVQYYKYKPQCSKALSELKTDNFSHLSQWTRKYESLGSDNLLLFKFNYIESEENLGLDVIKIQEGLYTERKPFASIILFCEVFQHLYWNNCVHKRELFKEESRVIKELKSILDTFYINKKQE